MAKTAKKAAAKKDQPRASRTKKPDADKGARQLKDLNTALAPLAEEGRRKKATEARTAPEYGMDKLGASSRRTAEEIANAVRDSARDPFKPDVERGPNVDVVNGRWKTTNKEDLQRIAKNYVSASKSAKTASGVKADILNKAEENKNLDKWCFKKAVDWMLMGDEVLVRRLPLFLKYLDDLGVSDRSTAQADLLDAANKPKADEDDDGQSDLEGKLAQQKAAETEAKGDEAKAAAAGLAPSRRAHMTIVPKPPAEDAKPPAEGETESPPTAPSTATG